LHAILTAKYSHGSNIFELDIASAEASQVPSHVPIINYRTPNCISVNPQRELNQPISA